MRRYVGVGLDFLCQRGWKEDVEGGLDVWLEVMSEEGVGPLSVGMGKPGEGEEGGGWGEKLIVGDGVRYHVLDVWVDEIEKVRGERKDADKIMPWSVVERLLEPVRELAREGRTKTVRRRAKDVLVDERLDGWKGGGIDGGEKGDEWGGLE